MSHKNRSVKNGDRFGKIEIVTSYVEKTKSGDYKHLCRCDCGAEKLMRGGNIKVNKGCGCSNKEKTSGIEVGQRFGEWEVLETFTSKDQYRRWHHLCRCKCGLEVEVEGTRLKRGKSNNCKTCRERFRKDGITSAKNRLYGQYASGASRRGYDFDISLEDFVEECVKPCHYCGVEGSRVSSTNHKNKEHRSHFVSNGLDRVDNTLGYSKENCVACCGSCNQLKGAMDQSKFIAQLQKICSHAQTSSKV
jgi:hypothetical protein